MQTKLTHSFVKDLRSLPLPVKKRVLETIEACKIAESVADIPNRKSLYAKKNHNFFRIRVGDYRVGVQIIGDVLTFEMVGVRGDFYKKYPPK